MTWNWCAKCLSILSDDGDGVQVEAIYLLEEERRREKEAHLEPPTRNLIEFSCSSCSCLLLERYANEYEIIAEESLDST